MTHTLRDGSTVTDPRLGRIHQDDPASANFPMSAVLDQAAPVVSRLWPISKVLDQGQQGSCVGHGFSHELIAEPMPHPELDHPYAVGFYYDAQRCDGQRGGEYPGAKPVYGGTSVLAGAKVARRRGFYTSYHWTTDITDVAAAISQHGPVVVGTKWLQQMFTPGPDGFLDVSGAVAGGHCYLIIGVNIEDGYFTICNSWSASWGDNGTAKIRGEDLAKLLDDQGEACLPLRQK